MLSEDTSVQNNGENDSVDNPPKSSNADGKTSSLLEDEDGEEINLNTESRSKLRLDASLDPGSTSAPEPTSILDQPVPPPKEEFLTNNDFILELKISDFEKKGDGMNAYIVYKLITKCENVPGISDRTYEVWRRFSDFLGLHDKLYEKYISKGVIVPAAPEKSIAAMTKTKATSDPATSREVAVRRARQLERFMRRIIQHPRLRVDCDVRDFLTMETELPRASQTATLSGAGVKRMIKSVGEVFSKMAFHMEEGDRWLELSGKNDRASALRDEMDEAVRRMDQLEAEFGELSKLIREEIGRFEVQRRHDMRQMFIEYLQSLVQTHTEMLEVWEKFEPETRSIFA
ncbi:PX domain protein [Oesophagostomum dentatum]|uniref:PX domain protein n=1 Tax=Oesophagostomum dentatum TaxID=61180 RepID=A0A0B1TGQ2_OESDE|nr:PX domain protein [Oesophagostomum dentatum]